MPKTILIIDGENFRYKVEEVLNAERKDSKSFDFAAIELDRLLKTVLHKYSFTEKRYYGAKIRFHKDTQRKSHELIVQQRRLKTNLEKRGFTFVLAGNVRAQEVVVNRHKRIVFREKGVDVRIAVDLMSFACGKKIDTVVLCSSDSDLQPAIAELRKRHTKVIYLGFQMSPNKGLTYTSNETILFRNNEILSASVKNRDQNES